MLRFEVKISQGEKYGFELTTVRARLMLSPDSDACTVASCTVGTARLGVIWVLQLAPIRGACDLGANVNRGARAECTERAARSAQERNTKHPGATCQHETYSGRRRCTARMNGIERIQNCALLTRSHSSIENMLSPHRMSETDVQLSELCLTAVQAEMVALAVTLMSAQFAQTCGVCSQSWRHDST